MLSRGGQDRMMQTHHARPSPAGERVAIAFSAVGVLSEQRSAGGPSVKSEIEPRGLFPWHQADAMFLLLVRRAADLQGCHEGSPDAEELECLLNAIDAYEAKRFAGDEVRLNQRFGRERSSDGSDQSPRFSMTWHPTKSRRR